MLQNSSILSTTQTKLQLTEFLDKYQDTVCLTLHSRQSASFSSYFMMSFANTSGAEPIGHKSYTDCHLTATPASDGSDLVQPITALCVSCHEHGGHSDHAVGFHQEQKGQDGYHWLRKKSNAPPAIIHMQKPACYYASRLKNYAWPAIQNTNHTLPIIITV